MVLGVDVLVSLMTSSTPGWVSSSRVDGAVIGISDHPLGLGDQLKLG